MLGVLWGCQKIESISDPLIFIDSSLDNPQQNPITVEEVKQWYAQKLAVEQGTNSLGEDSTLLPRAKPEWGQSKNGFSQTSHQFLITPLAIGGNNHAQFKLLATRQLDGTIIGKLVIYVPDKAYHTAKKGAYSVEDFTGTAIYTSLGGKYEHGFYIENGQYKGQAKAKRAKAGGQPLGVRGCVLHTYTIQTYSPYVFSGDDYTIDVEYITCTDDAPPTTSGTPGGLGGNNGGGGGGAWGTGQPSNVFTQSELDEMRAKYYRAGLEEIWYTLELRQDLLKATNLFLDTKSWSELHKMALLNLVTTTSNYKALENYLTVLSSHTDFYNANAALNFPLSAMESLDKYKKANFTTEEFVQLWLDPNLFAQVDAFLNSIGLNNITATNLIDKVWSKLMVDEGISNLNDQERALALGNKIEFLSYAVDSRVAIDATRTRFNGNIDVGNDRNIANAFQHSYWNALLTRHIGRDRAKVWTDAHESGGVTPFATDMDFFNNEVGRRIGTEWNSNIIGLPDLIMQNINSGMMQYVCFDGVNSAGLFANQRLRFTNQTCP